MPSKLSQQIVAVVLAQIGVRSNAEEQVGAAVNLDALLAASNGSTSDSARRAAEEIAEWMNWRKNIPQIGHQQNIATLTNMLSKYFVAAAPADNDAEFQCECCQRQMELRIDGKFCNECASGIRGERDAIVAHLSQFDDGELGLLPMLVADIKAGCHRKGGR